MSSYIKIYVDGNTGRRINEGLRRIIIFIGRNDMATTKCRNDNLDFYRGINIINSRLKKLHKTAIKSLVFSKIIHPHCDGNASAEKYCWKIHSTKARKVFRTIRRILCEKDNAEMIMEFDAICGELQRAGARCSGGADAVAWPYYGEMNSIVLNPEKAHLYKQDVCKLKKCIREIEQFNMLY